MKYLKAMFLILAGNSVIYAIKTSYDIGSTHSLFEMYSVTGVEFALSHLIGGLWFVWFIECGKSLYEDIFNK